jgi:predicted oxidoreductase
MAFVLCHGILGCVLEKIFPNLRLKTIRNLGFKIPCFSADTILLSWILKYPAKVIPIAGTVM